LAGGVYGGRTEAETEGLKTEFGLRGLGRLGVGGEGFMVLYETLYVVEIFGEVLAISWLGCMGYSRAVT